MTIFFVYNLSKRVSLFCKSFQYMTDRSVCKKGKTMNQTHFTPEQISVLKSNPFTKHVSEKSIRFTDAFKEAFLKKLLSGMSARQVFAELGYDPDIIGHQRIANTRYLITRELLGDQASEEEQLAQLKAEIKVLENKVEMIQRLLAFNSRHAKDRKA